MPVHDEYMRSSREGVYVAGDLAGIEEASTAMEEGRLAGLHAAYSMGYLDEAGLVERAASSKARLLALRSGRFGAKRLAAKATVLDAARADAARADAARADAARADAEGRAS